MLACGTCSAPNPDDATRCGSCGAQPTLAPRGGRDATVIRKLEERTAIGPVPIPESLGERIGGDRYELLALLGRGGMGLVYRARDLQLGGDDIAIKLLHPVHAQEPQELERLKREILTARRITHPNVIRIHDFGISAGEGFISMEMLAGGTLAERLAAGRVPLPRALEIAIGICDGLAAAHAQGIVHRDLKPQNVLFDVEGRPKLSDFGLARISGSTQSTTGISGTPHYMSPEMVDGEEITPRSDVYSLGVVLFELFTGKVPFEATTLVRLAMMHAKEKPPRPRSIDPDLPAGIEALLLRSLQKSPARRQAGAAEVAAELRAAGSVAGSPAPGRPRKPSKQGRPAKPALWLGIAGVTVACGVLAGARFYPAPATTRIAENVPASAVPSSTPGTPAEPTNVLVGNATTARPSPTAPRQVERIPPAPTPAPTRRTVASVARGSLTVRARPWAEVWIDGKRAAPETPLRDHPLPAGIHVVELRNPAFRPRRTRVEIRPGEETIVDGNLRAGRIDVR